MPDLKIRRLGYALGAEIAGLDLTENLDDATVAAIRRAWMDHVLLVFPGQNLTPTELIAFCGRFCDLDDFAWKPENTRFNLSDFPQVQLLANKPVVVKEQTVRSVVANEWHSDNCYMERPASGIFLNAKELPDVGGDTLFANLCAAYDNLSPTYQRIADSLEAVHDGTATVDYSRQSAEVRAERQRRNPPYVRPLVRAHPETGRKALYVSRVRSFVGMTEDESKSLLTYLNQHAVRHEFMYRHRWSAHDLVMWDNARVLHYAAQDYDRAQLRVLQRCNGLVPKDGRPYVESRDGVLAGVGA